MPHPITKPGLGTRQPPKVILERPRLGLLIGAIAGEWGTIDEAFGTIFNLASYSQFKGDMAQLDPMATAIFAGLVATSAKTDLILTALRLRIPSLHEEFKDLAKKARRLSGIRNTVIHASWHISDDYPNDLITYDLNGFAVRYTEPCLKEILEQSMNCRNSVLDFSRKAHLAPKVQPLRPSP